MNDFFADGIGNISVGNGVVRIEFVVQRFQQPGPDKQAKPPKIEATHHLVLPLGGFLNSLVLQEQVRAQLIKEGVIKLPPEGQPAPAAS